MSVLRDRPGGLNAGHVEDFPPGSVTPLELELTTYDWDPSTGSGQAPYNQVPAAPKDQWPDDPNAPQRVSPVPIYLVHDGWCPTCEAGFLALYRRDPFRGCGVQWRPAEERFIDPCYGSHYDWHGAYQSGPSGRGLDRFEATVRTKDGENYVMVDLSYLIPGPPPDKTVPWVIEPVSTPTPAPIRAPAATP